MEPDSSVDSAAHLELLAAIAWALSEISNQDAGALPSEGELTVFHASGQSVISILDYVMRIASFINCSFECYVVAVIFLDRLLTANPHIRFGPYTAHRLIITAVVLAVKSIDDEYYRNSFYANVGGVPTHELNRMEVEFLVAMQYNLYVSEKEFAAYRDRLRWCMIEPTITADGSTSRSPLSASPQGWPRGTDDTSLDCDSTFPAPVHELPPLSDGRCDDIVVGGASVPTPVVAAVAVIDSPTIRRADDLPMYCDDATVDATRRAPSATPSGGGSALRAWVEVGCAPVAPAAPAATSICGAVACATGIPTDDAWGDPAWGTWDTWGCGGRDPWAAVAEDRASSLGGASSGGTFGAPAGTCVTGMIDGVRFGDAEAARERAGGFVPPLAVPPELAVPFPEPLLSTTVDANGACRHGGGFSFDLASTFAPRLLRSGLEEGPMRAGFAREMDGGDWGVAPYGILGVITA